MCAPCQRQAAGCLRTPPGGGRQDLKLIGRLLVLSRAGVRARADELRGWFDLTDAGGRPATTYSTGLDPARRDEVWDVVRGLVRDGATVLLTTQYLEEADALADEITVIDHGRVIAHDTPDGLERVVGGLRASGR